MTHRHDTLPPELARRWGNLQFVKYHGNGEYSAECPQCSDAGHVGRDFPDRFRMWTSPPRGWCRKCFYQAFADDDKPGVQISDDVRNKWVEERLQREKDAKAEIERRIAALEREQLWLRYHEGITNDALDWWASKGVPSYMVNTLFLGWCKEKTFWSGDKEFVTASATMPVFAPGWKIRTIRHRLINPIDVGDKYRPDRAGLPATLYLTNPEIEPSGECILVEGEIKSIVIYDRLDNYKLTVVGTPGKSFKPEILDKVKAGCDRVWVVFDPDAKLQAWKAAQYIGKASRVVYLPCKPDDAFTMYGASVADFWAALRYGRQA